MNPNEIRKLLEHHKKIVRDLEEELAVAEKGNSDTWIPQKFYTAYYILSGMLIGIVAAWITLLLNAVGSYILHDGDAFKLMRVYATFFGGEEALETNKAAILMLTVGIHTLTGAICGAPIHVVVSRLKPDFGLLGRLITGVALGVVMWLVNFYGILSWLQPSLVEQAYILEEIPVAVAISNHVAFTILVLLMQPMGTFAFHRKAGDEEARAP